jgi:hypothetical protein
MVKHSFDLIAELFMYVYLVKHLQARIEINSL